MDPDLRQLRAFVTVAEELHFGRAALRLELSQPQVSRQVRALEDALGVVLFVRDARRTTLTDAGAILLDHARETLDAAARLETRAALAARGGTGRVAVSFVWSTLGAYLPQLVAAAAEDHPEIELSVSQQHVREIVPALRRGDVDLVIARPLHQQSEMIEITLCREPALLAMPDGHELARGDEVSIEELRDRPMIAIDRALAPGAFDAALGVARRFGVELRIVRYVRSAAEALALVSAGIGLYRIPATAAPPHPGVTYRRFAEAPSRVVLMRRPEPPRPAVMAIIELARSLYDHARDASKDDAGALDAIGLAS